MPWKGQEERGRGVITAPATSGRVTVPLRVTFQVLEPTPSSTALSLTKCALTAWALVPIISYSVNSSFIKLCLDYMSFFFPTGTHQEPCYHYHGLLRVLLIMDFIINLIALQVQFISVQSLSRVQLFATP